MNTKFRVRMAPQKFQILDPISRDNNLISEVQVTLSILSVVHGSFVTIHGGASTSFFSIDVSQFLEASEKCRLSNF